MIKFKKLKKKEKEIIKLIGIFIPVGIAIVGAIYQIFTKLLRYFAYNYEKGRLNYWGIDDKYIQISDYDIIYTLLLVLLVLLYAFLIYLRKCEISNEFKNEKVGLYERIKKYLCHFVKWFIVFFVSEIVIILYSTNVSVIALLKDLWNMMKNGEIMKILSLFFVMFCSYISVTIFSIIFPIYDFNKENKKEKKNKLEKIKGIGLSSLIVVVTILICTYMFRNIGNNEEDRKKEFKIINNQVVLYEDKNNYIVSKCDIKSSDKIKTISIYANNQKIISKKNQMVKIVKCDKMIKK